jgi:hypothetical protein
MTVEIGVLLNEASKTLERGGLEIRTFSLWLDFWKIFTWQAESKVRKQY